MNEQEFIEYYRNIVVNGNESFPLGSWNEVSKDLDIDLVWNNLSDDLDVDEVWSNISTELVKDKRRKTVKLIVSWSIAASILILGGLFFMDKVLDQTPQLPTLTKADATINSQNENKPKTITEQNDYPDKNSTLLLNENVRLRVIAKTNQIDKADEPLVELDNPINQTQGSVSALVNQEEKHFNEIDNRVKEEMMIPKEIAHQKVGIVEPINIQNTQIVLSANQENTSKVYIKGRFSIGISNVVRNTWLINRETIEGFNRSNFNSTKIKFFPDFGINVKYILSERWSIEGSGFISSRSGQSYDEYIYGNYSSKNLTIQYTSFEISTKQTVYKSKIFKNANYHTIVGTYFSKLHSASKAIDYSVENVSNEYLNLDYGVILGCDIEFRIFKSISIAPGARIKMGFPNIYRGDSEMPAELNKTRNGSLDFRVSIYYNIH